jgi:sulfate permease
MIWAKKTSQLKQFTHILLQESKWLLQATQGGNSMMIFIAFMVAFFFAANIGASGTAATMSAAYGGGAVKNRIVAVSLVAVFALIGANLGGYEVTATLSEGLIPSDTVSLEVAVIILSSACITLFTANRMGIPLSTSEVTVGSIVGVGLAFQQLYWGMLLVIILTWVLLPCIAFGAAYGFGKIIRPFEGRWLGSKNRLVKWLLAGILLLTGCYEAFSAGMNNVANAIGPLISSGLIDIKSGILWGSIFLAIGAITLGGKVLETNGKKITSLNLVRGSIVSFTGGTLVLIASFFGIPVPLTQATTMAIIGVGSEKVGWTIFKKPVVKKIIRIWVISPLSSLFLSFSFVQILILQSYTYISLLFFVFIVMAVYLVPRIKARRTGQTLFISKHRKE